MKFTFAEHPDFRNDISQLSEQDVISLICKTFNCPQSTLFDKKRKGKTARFLYYYILRHYYDLTYYKIAEYTGKDHSAIIYGVNKIVDILANNTKFLNESEVKKINDVIDKINEHHHAVPNI